MDDSRFVVGETVWILSSTRKTPLCRGEICAWAVPENLYWINQSLYLVRVSDVRKLEPHYYIYPESKSHPFSTHLLRKLSDLEKIEECIRGTV